MSEMNVRTIYTADRIEFHAETCQHRIPHNAEVFRSDRPVSDLIAIDAESVALGTQRVVQPCIRRQIKQESK